MKKILVLVIFLLSVSIASAISVNSVELADLGFTGFVVEANLDTSGTAQVLYGKTGALGSASSLASSSTEHLLQVDGLESGTVYFYRVVGKDSQGNSYSSAISLTRTPRTSPGSSSQELIAVEAYDITDTTFRVKWSLNTPSTGQIEMGSTSNLGNFMYKETQLQTSHDMRLSELQSGKSYYYRVIGEDTNGNTYSSDVRKVILGGSTNTGSTQDNSDSGDTSSTSGTPVNGELKAFPSAYGAGAYASGGRGGKVIHVTNLNDDGPGSFRAAVTASGPRIVVFDVSGTIKLTKELSINKGDLTIAGQTAPDGGITIVKDGVWFTLGTSSWITENIIIRHIRSRPTLNGWGTLDALEMYRVRDVIIDHSSFSWGADEGLSTWGKDIDRLTFQNNIIAESKTGTLFGAGKDSKTTDELSLHRNVYYDISHRFPNPNTYGRLDVINNIIFNWKAGLSQITESPKFNYVNNYHGLGCLSSTSGIGHKLNDGNTNPKIYAAGNYVNKGQLTNPNADNWGLFEWWGYATGKSDTQVIPRTHQVSAMWPLVGAKLPLVSATQAFAELTADAGASKRLDGNGNVLNNHDFVDKLFLANVKKGDCVPYQSSSSGANYDQTSHYKQFHNAVSSTPKARHPSNYDVDRDGMPDAWERANGFVVGTDDSAGDKDGDGYTNIEEFINLVG